MDKKSEENQSIKDKSTKEFGLGKRILFTAILFLIPVIFIILLECGLRLLDYGEEYPLFIDTELFNKEYRMCNPAYGKKYFHGESYSSPANDMFLQTKPENGFRIFVIGSSTVYGFPYSEGVMFSRILHKRLRDSYPNHHIEVINTAITAVNSYTFADRIDEILNEEPDAILIYAGHNEFYGAQGIGSHGGLSNLRVIKLLHLHMLNYKIYQLLQNGIHKTRNILSGTTPDKKPETATLMERIVKNKNIEYQGRIYNQAHRHYKANMNTILRKSNNKDIPVFFSEVISNIRDLPPFKSSKNSEHPPAIEVYKNAKALDSAQNYFKAKKQYIMAKDLDCIRFRASEDINEIIRKLSDQHNTHLVPMQEAFEAKSPQGIIGNNLLTEHVHPNVDGMFLMADVFYRSIVESKTIEVLDSANYKPSSYYRNQWGFTELDSLYADIRVQQLMNGWPFKHEAHVNRFIHEYEPQNAIDSTAYMALIYNDISLEAAHNRMAGYYKVRNEFRKAALEYRAMAKINPWNLKSYIDAGNLFMKSGNNKEALKVFKESLNLARENFTLLSIGEIYSQLENHEKAIQYLEEVLIRNPDFNRFKVLNLLHKSYHATNKKEQAEKISVKLSQMEDTGVDRPQVVIYTPPSVRPKIEKALTHLRANEINKGLELLYKANKIEESSIANRLIGEIYLQGNDKRALNYLKKAYYDYLSDPAFLNNLCYASIAFNDYAYAKKILGELKQLDPNNSNIKRYEKALSKTK